MNEKRINELFDRLGHDVTAQEFAQLGLLCLDQGGMDAANQKKVADIARPWSEPESPIG